MLLGGVVRVREEEVQNEVDPIDVQRALLLPMFSPTPAAPPVNTITPGVVRVREEEVQNEEEPIEVQIRKKRQSPGIGSHRTLYSGSSDGGKESSNPTGGLFFYSSILLFFYSSILLFFYSSNLPATLPRQEKRCEKRVYFTMVYKSTMTVLFFVQPLQFPTL